MPWKKSNTSKEARTETGKIYLQVVISEVFFISKSPFFPYLRKGSWEPASTAVSACIPVRVSA